MRLEPYVVNPRDPRAPPQEVWERMTYEERVQVLASLPSEFPLSEAMAPEGGQHFEAKVRTVDVLGSFFSRIGRKVFLGCELPVYYPDEPMFAPDVMAVLDVEPHVRKHWTVGDEGKGVDLALEIHVSGERRKDVQRNMKRYARLGVREYLVFGRKWLRLMGWRLVPGSNTYQPILPKQGFYTSEVLGLELHVVGERLRFYYGGAPLPESFEMIATLRQILDEVETHRTEEAQSLAELEQRLEEEQRRREETERLLTEARAELERLRGGR